MATNASKIPSSSLFASRWLDAGCLLALITFALSVCWPVLTGRVPAAMDTLSIWGPQALTHGTSVHNTAIADSALQYIPWQMFVRNSLQAGEWPIWNLDLFAGYPFLGNDQNQLYYPVAWLLLALPLSGALQVGAVLHVFLAGTGMFILGRVLGLSRVGSLLAGLAFAGSGQLYTSIEMVGVSSIYVWLPYVLATAELSIRHRSWGWAVTSGLLLGVMAVAGHLPWFLYGGAFLILWLGGCLLAELQRWRQKMRGGESWPHNLAGVGAIQVLIAREGRALAGNVARSLAILVLGPAVAMIHLLPFFQTVSLSSRIQSEGFAPPNVGLDGIPSLLVSHLNLFVPRFNGTALDGSGGTPADFNNCWYVGLVALALAFAALALKREWRIRLLGVVAGFSLAVAIGLPLFNMVHQLPGLQQQIPERISYLFIVCTSLLAAYGYDAAIEAVRRRTVVWLIVSAAVLVLGCGIVFALLLNRADAQSNPGLHKLQNEAITQAAVLGALVMAWMCALFTLRTTHLRVVAAALPAFIVVLAWADLLTYFPAYNTYLTPEYLSPTSGAADAMRSDPSLWRMMAIDEPKTVFPPNSSVYYGLHDVQGYDSLHLERMDDYWAPTQAGTSGSPSNYFGVHFRPQNFRTNQAYLLNAKYITTYLPLLMVRQTGTDQDLGELAGNRMAESFEAPGKLSSLEFAFDTQGYQVTSPVILRVRKSLTDTEDLVRQSLDPSSWRGLTWATFSFPPLNLYKGQPVVAILETPENRPGTSVHVLGADVSDYNRGPLRLYQRGTWQERSMAFVARAELPSDLLRGYEKDIGVYTSTSALPRVFTVAQYQVMPAAQIPAKLADRTFDPGKVVLLETEPPAAFRDQSSLTENQTAGTATVISYRNLSVEINAHMRTKGWLVLCDINYPGWSVEVDGQPAPLYTAYYILRAVPLLPGEHTVRFVFRPASVAIGGASSSLALLCIFGTWLAAYARLRRSSRPALFDIQKT